jgi:hypothetical protein
MWTRRGGFVIGCVWSLTASGVDMEQCRSNLPLMLKTKGTHTQLWIPDAEGHLGKSSRSHLQWKTGLICVRHTWIVLQLFFLLKFGEAHVMKNWHYIND